MDEYQDGEERRLSCLHALKQCVGSTRLGPSLRWDDGIKS